jgi:hypothetical protein
MLQRFGLGAEGVIAIIRAVSMAIFFSATLAGAGGCQSDEDAVRAQARARGEEWARQAQALAGLEEALRERIVRAPGVAANADDRTRLARLRAEALAGGSRQSLADLRRTIEQAGARIEAAVRADGPAAAGEALEREHARMLEVMRMLREQLGSAEQELARSRSS